MQQTAASTETKPEQIGVTFQWNVGPELLATLKLALPYVQKIAATMPTEMERQRRQQQAVKDVATIKAAITKAEG